MSRSQNVAQSAQELRILARRYCDGDMTKSEYRRRRRQLLTELLTDSENPSLSHSERTMQESELRSGGGLAAGARWPIVVMVVASVMVLGVMAVLVAKLI